MVVLHRVHNTACLTCIKHAHTLAWLVFTVQQFVVVLQSAPHCVFHTHQTCTHTNLAGVHCTTGCGGSSQSKQHCMSHTHTHTHTHTRTHTFPKLGDVVDEGGQSGCYSHNNDRKGEPAIDIVYGMLRKDKSRAGVIYTLRTRTANRP